MVNEHGNLSGGIQRQYKHIVAFTVVFTEFTVIECILGYASAFSVHDGVV